MRKTLFDLLKEYGEEMRQVGWNQNGLNHWEGEDGMCRQHERDIDKHRRRANRLLEQIRRLIG